VSKPTEGATVKELLFAIAYFGSFILTPAAVLYLLGAIGDHQ